MHSFKDTEGRSWLVRVNVAAVRSVRALLGVDLYGLVDDRMRGLSDLLGDPCRFVDVLYVLCKADADKLGVTDESFGSALGGDALGAAADAFVAGLVDFFPDPRKRAALTKVLDAGKRVTERVMDRAEAEIAAVDVDSLATQLIASFGTSRASSGSTQGPSPSANST